MQHYEEKHNVSSLPFWVLSARQLCDLELIVNEAFAPLTGFLGLEDYLSVVHHMRLSSGALWPMPITLDIPQSLADQLTAGSELALRDPEGVTLAVLTIDSLYQPDHHIEAQQVFGTQDKGHPGVAALYRQHPFNVGGAVKKVESVTHYDFVDLRLSPRQVKREIARRGWEAVVAFQTRNPMHCAHVELTLRAMKQANAALLLQPVVGLTKPDDIDYYTRVRCYKHALKSYATDTVLLSLLPLAMRMGGPREAVWHALIRKNFGATHFIVGRDHAGPGNDKYGKAFYAPYAAQEMALAHAEEIGLQILAFEEMLYLKEEQRYAPASEVPPGAAVLSLSGTAVRESWPAAPRFPIGSAHPISLPSCVSPIDLNNSKDLSCSLPACRARASRRLPTALPYGYGKTADGPSACWMATWSDTASPRGSDFQKRTARPMSNALVLWPSRLLAPEALPSVRVFPPMRVRARSVETWP